jgi:hypothetical protein
MIPQYFDLNKPILAYKLAVGSASWRGCLSVLPGSKHVYLIVQGNKNKQRSVVGQFPQTDPLPPHRRLKRQHGRHPLRICQSQEAITIPANPFISTGDSTPSGTPHSQPYFRMLAIIWFASASTFSASSRLAVAVAA